MSIAEQIADVLAGRSRWCVVTGDCLDVLRTIPAGSVDAVVTDPVWPNAIETLAGSEDPVGLMETAAAAFPEGVKRLSVTLGSDSDPRFLWAVPQGFPFFRVCWLRYARPKYKGRMLNGGDVAYFFGEPPPSREGARVIPGEFCQVLRNKEPHNNHPCPRNFEHMAWIVDKWTAPDEVILDPFCGSGTTGAACVAAGRRFIGIEIDPGYADIARRRIGEAANHLFANTLGKNNEPLRVKS